jgi:hypothetical protein
VRHGLLAAVAAATLLTACGGGSSIPASSPGAGGASNSSALSPSDVAQAGTSAAFEPVDTGEADAGVGNGSLGGSSSLRAVQALPHACRHRTSRTVTANPDGSTTVETIHYYDDACTQVERDAVAVRTSSGGSATVDRTVTTFDKAHAQLGVRKETYALTGSTASGSWTVTSAFYPGTATTPLEQFGHAASLGNGTYTANTGRIVNDAKPSIDSSFGHQVAVNATVATDSANDTTFAGTRNGTFFKAPLNGLTLSSTPPFTVSGGTQLGTSALQGSVTFDADGILSAIALNGSLAGGNTLAVTSTTDANGVLTVNGTVTSPAGTPVSTFTTDASGNGVLTLTASGTQVPIVDWHVIWT